MQLHITTPNSNQLQSSYEDLLAQKSFTVLYFYPKDNTSGCTIEAGDFRDLAKEFESLDAQIIWVSRDTHKSHCGFVSKQNLNFQLISDTDSTLHNKFQTLGEKSMYGRKYIGTIRSTFLLDSKGTILAERRNVSVSDHAKKVLEKLQEVVMDRK